MLKFEWNILKDASNQKKHGISFTDASTCFHDPLHILIDDPDSAPGEGRLILIGSCKSLKTLVVVHLDSGNDVVRIISARKASKKERKQYEGI